MPRKTNVTLAWLASCLLPLLCALLCAPSAHAEMPGAAGFCFWTRTLEDGRTHQTFLRRLQGGQLALYHAVWAPDGRPRECVSSRDAAVTHGYRAECQERRPELFSRRPQRSFDTRALFRPGVCVDADAREGVGGSVPVRHTRDLLTQQRRAHTEGSRSVRAKRGLIMIPGTLWCGTGNSAANYSDLGAFPHTDECCREHDHCKHTIASFNYGYGVFNSNIFTLSHCDCDNRFKQCLQRAEDAMGFVVGYGYFNVLKMRCFEWTMHTECTERAWWGRCLSTGPVRYAEVQEPTDFNSTLTENATLPYPSQMTKLYSEMTTKLDSDPTTKPDSDLTMKPDSHPTTKPDSEHTTKLDSEHTTQPDSAPTTQPDSAPTTQPDSAATTQPDSAATTQPDSAATTKPDSALTSKPSQEGSSELKLTTPPQPIMPTINVPDTRTDAADARTDLLTNRTDVSDRTGDLLTNRTDVSDRTGDLQGSTPSSSLLLPTTTATAPEPSGPLRVCGVYKLLDDCRLQVPPLQEVFGLKNTELRTLYHCNCTKRLAEHMPVLEAAGLHTLMLDFVAESCFILPHTHSSGPPQSSAVLLQMPFFLPGRGWDKRPAGRRHLLDRARKFNQSKRAKRKDLGVRLYRKCLRMHSRLQKPRRH